MTKFLLIVVVIAVALAWLAAARRRDVGSKGGSRGGGKARAPEPPAPMVACVRCGVHLPQPEALVDAAGRPYCSEAHRLAGPR